MSASHHGEDAHVRTIQAMLRRAGLSQSLLACGSDGAPADTLTAARLAREGEAPGPIRHNCSGFHTSSLLLSRLAGWSLPDYWRPEHPSQVAVADAVARLFRVKRTDLVTAVDNCGVLTYAFPMASDRPSFRAAGRSRGWRGRDPAFTGAASDARARRDEDGSGHGRWLARCERHADHARPPGLPRFEGWRRGSPGSWHPGGRARQQVSCGRPRGQDRGWRPVRTRQHVRAVSRLWPAGRVRRGSSRATQRPAYAAREGSTRRRDRAHRAGIPARALFGAGAEAQPRHAATDRPLSRAGRVARCD